MAKSNTITRYLIEPEAKIFGTSHFIKEILITRGPKHPSKIVKEETMIEGKVFMIFNIPCIRLKTHILYDVVTRIP